MSTNPATRSPLVSVIIPTYNSARFLHQALQSALEQTYQKREIIVVDDGSTDETKMTLGRFNGTIRYLQQEHQGAAAARNTGIQAANGDFICFLDADDIWASNKLDLQLDFLKRHRDTGLLSGRCRKFMDQGSPYMSFTAAAPVGNAVRIFPAPQAFTELVKFNFIPTSTVMIRKECFDKVGLFDLNLIPVEDRDLWLRISAHFEVAHLPWILCEKRLHRSNISNDKARMLYTRGKVLEKNRVLFPGLAPSGLWNKQLAKLYAKAGRLSLVKGQKEEARQAAVRSLKNALTAKAAMLFMATFMGPRAIRIFMRSRVETMEIKNPSSSLSKTPGEAAKP